MIINLVGNSIEVKASSTASPEYIALADILNIFPLYIPAASGLLFGTGYPNLYPYPSRTTVAISLDNNSNSVFRFELQEITAGALAGFNTGTKADLDNAVALINSWL